MTESTLDFSRSIVVAAAQVSQAVSARAMIAYVDAIPDVEQYLGSIQPPTDPILIIRDEKDKLRLREYDVQTLEVPAFNLTRMGQIKTASLMAFSQHILVPGDVFVFLSGMFGRPIDTIVTMQVGREVELFQSVDQPELTEHIKRVVFERMLTLALEIANEGREGKPTGALFVIGSRKELEPYCRQNIINPFKGYDEKERNILDHNIRETVKEFCSIDGAFVIKGNGTIVSAGTTLQPTMGGDPIPAGLGSRHATAAAITATTGSVALTVSESTGTVRVWRLGRMITEIERAPYLPSSR